ncbi:serine/threonine protein kinase, partial [bacterium]|nr:serine/threonine protein kinase [bacterium]MCI0603589.1 serine/threonine protein kinase [bacterium]
MDHHSPQPEESSAQNAANLPRFGRYQRIELIGQGGMGKVYKAYDPVLDRYVALKLIQSNAPESAIRFSTEAKAQAKVNHPHVCKIYEVGEAEGIRYIAMQLINGRALTDVAQELNFPQIAKILKQVAEGVHAAHQAGLIHRDLKPSNILVEKTEQGELIPYVLDFGLVREMNAGGLTLSGVLIGTPSYMSPEQARGQTRGVDSRTDVYSLGVTCYELLTKSLPFEAETTVDILLKLLNEDPASPRQKNPDIPADLEKIALKCLEKDPALRYHSALALAEDLGRFIEGEPIHARAPSLAYRLSKKAKKNQALFLTGGLAAILLLAFLLYILGVIYRRLSQFEMAHGQDPDQSLQSSIDALQRA